ncbi:MAG: hypothetical protein EOR03_12190 [Mesorhizobium sp.]|nr:MAG: hypothetical protein EOR03_12190 [Mesorhizobium sp.]
MRGVPAWHQPHSVQHPSTVLALRANPPSPTGGEGRALSGRTEGARRIAAAFILCSCIIRLKTFRPRQPRRYEKTRRLPAGFEFSQTLLIRTSAGSGACRRGCLRRPQRSSC